LDSIVQHLREQPTRPVVFVSHQAQDYEPLISLRRFLRARDVTNPLFLRLEDYEPRAQMPARYQPLADVLQQVSREGDAGVSARRGSRLPDECFEPIGE